MKRSALTTAILAALMIGAATTATASQSASQSSRTHSHTTTHPRTSHKATGVERDNKGRIKRSPAARKEFKRSHPCPSTGKSGGRCPGYVIDHVQALKHGGSDKPANMQWQTNAAAKAKDRVE
jgi:hypothetical protein